MSPNANPAPPFPLYLLPSIPFRRRRSSAATTSPTSTPSSSPPTQPSSFLEPTSTSHLRCTRCLTDLIPTSSIISKGFTGRHGRAYLVSPPTRSVLSTVSPSTLESEEVLRGDLPNTHTHKPVPRQLVTGAHTVSDISCRNCGTVLGWKYVEAEEDSQRYKVGKFILETKRVVRGADWEVEDSGRPKLDKKDEVEFDSQDEDECEDLFSGIWSPALARRRRKLKSFAVDESD
ncbi:yippee zinc-binding/DNA-binding /Mis18, centromere assembly-domain-containing protein [Lophiotrema nucula]|uniref:Yippee zinc-binding/DNA-binding /Mis18, centromere assembly-domain-containing protein n=1 Tax=Lophiotrema nucula TaxID=690887 RepID=A0A6A5Z811_9PLEO|nr:yippee zinc-binding/DNA-binding /Mis18, centromere assembly-domain-containing protein [Lophiotrema nucula]